MDPQILLVLFYLYVRLMDSSCAPGCGKLFFTFDKHFLTGAAETGCDISG